MITVTVILLVFAFVCFTLAALNVPSSRVNLVALGLAFWSLAELIPHLIR